MGRVSDTGVRGPLRIGTGLLGGGILLANAVHAADAAWYPGDLPYQMLVLAPGLAAGPALAMGAYTGRAADRRFAGICMAVAGARFLGGHAAPAALPHSDLAMVHNPYRMLVYSPAGPPLGAALLIVGIKAVARDRLAGLCMLAPGAAGFFPFLVLDPGLILWLGAAGDVLFYETVRHGGTAVGAALLALGLAMVRRGGPARRGPGGGRGQPPPGARDPRGRRQSTRTRAS